MGELGIGDAVVAEAGAVFVQGGVEYFLGGGQFLAAFFTASQMHESLATHEMGALAVGDELQDGIGGGNSLRVFLLAKIKPGEPDEGGRTFRIEAQGFVKGFFGVVVTLSSKIDESQLFVIIGKIRLDGDVLEKFGFGASIVAGADIG